LLNKTGPQPKSRFFNRPRQPRISLHFSYELNTKDMSIENINRWLAPAIDVSPLALPIAEQMPNTTQASITATPEPVAVKMAWTNNGQSLPVATVTGDLPNLGPNIGELTVTGSTGQARIYIDNAYSGFAPRTVRLRAGVHSILVIANGYAAWEQRLMIPGGKASIVKVDLQPKSSAD
jgi:hypothetical protein